MSEWIDINAKKPPLSYFGELHYEDKYSLINKFIILSDNGEVFTGVSYIRESYKLVVDKLFYDNEKLKFTHWIPFPGQIYKTEWNDINFKKPKEHGLYRVRFSPRRGEEEFYPHETERFWVGDNDKMRKNLRTEWDSNGEANESITYELTEIEKSGDIWASYYYADGTPIVEYSIITHWMQIDELSELYKP